MNCQLIFSPSERHNISKPKKSSKKKETDHLFTDLKKLNKQIQVNYKGYIIQ